MQTTFTLLLSPLSNYLQAQSEEVEKQAGSRTLFYENFIKVLIYGMSIKIISRRKLVLDLATNACALKLGFKAIPLSTLKDGFSRFNYKLINKLYVHLLSTINFDKVPDLKELGIFKLVDGSLFPTLISVDWAVYKKHKNSIRLHLSFCLNTLTPSEFLVAKGNSSERSFLKSIVEKGVTYIADRGYFSFDLAAFIAKSEAFFILRLKDNMIFEIKEQLVLSAGKHVFPICFVQITDCLIRFTNDPHLNSYRLVRFQVLNSHFSICTNRLDLNTLQIITCYAFRWQVELFFKFIKRTLNGIKLFSTSENGAQIHFLIVLITSLLQIHLKQSCLKKCQAIGEQNKKENSGFIIQKNEQINQYCGLCPDKWIQNIAEIFQNNFKISSDWLFYLKNFMAQEVDYQIIRLLAVT